MNSAQSLVILPANIQNASTTYLVKTNDYNQVQQHYQPNYQNSKPTVSSGPSNNVQSLIIVSANNATACQPINVSDQKPPVKQQVDSGKSTTLKRHQPIKPKIQQNTNNQAQQGSNLIKSLVNEKNEQPIWLNSLNSKAAKKRTAPSKVTKKKIDSVENSDLSSKSVPGNSPSKTSNKTKTSKRIKREPELDEEVNKICTNESGNSLKKPLATPGLPITEYSKSLFDSIEFLSSSWIDIFKTGNDTDKDSLNLFRQFHCADCLESFQQEKLADKKRGQGSRKNSLCVSSNLPSIVKRNIKTQGFKKNTERSQMNTPPAPLQKITDEAKNGLYHYFGQQNQIHQSPLPPIPPNHYQQQQQITNQFVNMNVIIEKNNSQLKLMPNLTQIGPDLQNSMANTKQIGLQNSDQILYSPFISQNVQMITSSGESDLNFNGNDSLDNSDQMNDDDDCLSQTSIQEKGQNLSRKLAQRRPKHELIECGILPRSRVSMQHHNRMIDLKKAQLQDILKTKIEKRPNRDTLIQKNILPDSAPHAAPSLIRKCTELKRARLADDLNDKLAKRPGPLELVESGILVSSDSALSEAIKDGKIQYPRTATYIQQLEQQVNYDQNFFNLDESNLNYLNFNFNNLTDNDDSNSSTSTTKTLASSSSIPKSTTIETDNIKNKTSNPFQTVTKQSPILPEEIINFNDLFPNMSHSPAAPSPPTSTQVIAKHSPSSSPFHSGQNFDFLPTAQDKPALKSQISKSKSKSFSSNSSVTSNSSSSSSKTSRSSRNNSQSNSHSGPHSNASAGSNYTRKLSQLIFHEYRGPNQKSSKSSISLKTNISLKKNSNNVINAFNFQRSNLVVNNSNNSAAANSSSTNTNEIFFDDSNDSTNNLNSAIMNISSVSEALNPHKIRIKQQKIFLKYNGSQLKSRDNSENGQHVMEQQCHRQIEEKNENGVGVNMESVGNVNQMDISVANQNLGLNEVQQSNSPPTRPYESNNNQQPANLMPLNNVNLGFPNIFQSNEFMSEVNQLPVASFNNEKQAGNGPSPNPNLMERAKQLSQLKMDVQFNNNHTNGINKSVNGTKNELPNNQATVKQPNIEEMSLNELKDECRRRKLLVTGNKQKLMDRIKASISSSQINVKSPDSGVNMDNSPSFLPNDQTSFNSFTNGTNNLQNIPNQLNKFNPNVVTSKLPPSTLTNESNQLPKADSTQNQQKQSSAKTSSNLDDFFNFLDVKNLGNDSIIPANTNPTAKPAKTLSKQPDKATTKLESNQPIELGNEILANCTNDDNLSATKATLEISLKNSAELLKQLSSIGQIDYMHQLESQMKESMQLIEQLKSASNSHQVVKEDNTAGGNFFETINNYPNKLRTVTSIPSDLRQLEIIKEQSVNGGQYFQRENIHYPSQVQLNSRSDIPFSKNFQINSNSNEFNQLLDEPPSIKTPVNSNDSPKPAVYQFDNLMKELSTSLTDHQSHEVKFSCESPQDDENSNETDLIRNKKIMEQQQHKSQLPSIDSLIAQNMKKAVVEESHRSNKSGQEFNQNLTTHYHSNSEMEWNDTEFLTLCEELDNTNNLFVKHDIKNSLQKTQNGNNVLINGQINNYNIYENFPINTNETLNRDVITNQNFIQQNHQTQSVFNSDSNLLNFPSHSNNQQQQSSINLNICNNGANDCLNGQNHQMMNITGVNGNNANMMVPWEFDNDLNQISTFLSPTV